MVHVAHTVTARIGTGVTTGAVSAVATCIVLNGAFTAVVGGPLIVALAVAAGLDEAGDRSGVSRTVKVDFTLIVGNGAVVPRRPSGHAN